MKRLLLLSAVLMIGVLFAAAPARAELVCAPDPFEKDTAATAAPLAVGSTVNRAICQEPTPQPRTESPRDEDYFVFTATAGKAYTIEAANVGAALVNNAFDRGGLQLGLSRLNADGSTSTVDQNRSLNGDRIITGPLAAGQYLVLAYTADTQIYPETNTMDVKTVQGPEGTYGVRLAETSTASAPVVTSLRLSSTSVKGGSTVTGTYTLSAPAPAGGMVVDVKSSHIYNAYPSNTYAPAGATRVSFPITTRRSSTDLRVTLSAWARVGPTHSVVLTVRR